jgi:predicted transposase/invertase (TIGR01784 family)
LSINEKSFTFAPEFLKQRNIVMESDKEHKNSKKGLGVFINPRSDFGFKKIFNDSRMMMSFVNAVISKRIENKDFLITSLTYLPVEHLGETEAEARIIVDSRCRTNMNEDILVEMQNARPKNFIERLIYYCSYLIRGQIPARRRKAKNSKKSPKWYYAMKAIYVIAIVNFPLIKDEKSKDTVIDWIRLMSMDTKQIFSEKLNFIIVDLTKFNKKPEDMKTIEDFWLYTLKQAETLNKRPAEINDELFIELYEDILQINKLTFEEMETYNKSILNMDDYGLFTEYAKEEGLEEGLEKGIKIGRREGREEGRKEEKETMIVESFKNKLPLGIISSIVGLSQDEIIAILRKYKLMS